jgi:predicted transcriptional regulator
MTRREGRARGALEREILACLAAAGEPMTAAQVQAELGGELAYTTVMTTLARLNAKHALSRTPVGRAYAYSLDGNPESARTNMTAHQMVRLLDEESDRAAVLARFVAELQPEDERLLAGVLDKGVDPPPRRRGGKR